MKYPEELREFGQRIRKYREAMGYSQQELADNADITKRTLQRIELGRAATNLEVMIDLAKALQKELFDLFRREN